MPMMVRCLFYTHFHLHFHVQPCNNLLSRDAKDIPAGTQLHMLHIKQNTKNTHFRIKNEEHVYIHRDYSKWTDPRSKKLNTSSPRRPTIFRRSMGPESTCSLRSPVSSVFSSRCAPKLSMCGPSAARCTSSSQSSPGRTSSGS